MSYQTLYRSWRPQRFQDIVGQEHVVRTLRNAVKAGRVAHAYLFCGPRGTGKTTTAKTLAKSLNCLERKEAEPCGACELCLAIAKGNAMDVLEIDGASNRGVDEIRELREKVKYYPATGKYKVYIVDEVHMLTNEAFNALLKTLEEPPQHVVFVLATTEPHKLPLTIISRCQRFDFRRIRKEDLVRRLEEIVDETGLVIEPEAYRLIARVADGSLRDALSILDQAAVIGENRITTADLHSILGTVTEEVLQRLMRCLFDGDAAGALLLLAEVESSGKELRIFSREITDYLREKLHQAFRTVQEGDRENGSRQREELIKLLSLFAEAEQQVRFASRQIIPLEMAVIKACTRASSLRGKGADSTPRAAESDSQEDLWGSVLAEFRKQNPPLAPWLVRAKPVIDEDKCVVTLKFREEIAKEKLNLPENLLVLKKILSRLHSGDWQVRCTLEATRES